MAYRYRSRRHWRMRHHRDIPMRRLWLLRSPAARLHRTAHLPNGEHSSSRAESRSPEELRGQCQVSDGEPASLSRGMRNRASENRDPRRLCFCQKSYRRLPTNVFTVASVVCWCSRLNGAMPTYHCGRNFPWRCSFRQSSRLCFVSVPIKDISLAPVLAPFGPSFRKRSKQPQSPAARCLP